MPGETSPSNFCRNLVTDSTATAIHAGIKTQGQGQVFCEHYCHCKGFLTRLLSIGPGMGMISPLQLFPCHDLNLCRYSYNLHPQCPMCQPWKGRIICCQRISSHDLHDANTTIQPASDVAVGSMKLPSDPMAVPGGTLTLQKCCISER